jgi:Protein of unknown function (DUF1697)
MMTFIALLRAINLGNHRSLAMSALRDFIAISRSPMPEHCSSKSKQQTPKLVSDNQSDWLWQRLGGPLLSGAA